MDIPENELKQIEGIAYKVYKKSFNTIEFDDLFQEGVLAYLKAKKNWDFSKNDYFMGFAYKRIYGAMLDYVAANSLSKRNTVRPSLPQVEYKVVPSVEGMEDSPKEDTDIIDFLYIEEIKDKFNEYIDTLTPLEREILYRYFIKSETMVYISKVVKINRLKIKVIIVNCVGYLRRIYNPLAIKDKVNTKLIGGA